MVETTVNNKRLYPDYGGEMIIPSQQVQPVPPAQATQPVQTMQPTGMEAVKAPLSPYVAGGQKAYEDYLKAISPGGATAFQTTPAYEFQQQQILKGVGQQLAATGKARSGVGVREYAAPAIAELAGREYQSYLDRLKAPIEMGFKAAGAMSDIERQELDYKRASASRVLDMINAGQADVSALTPELRETIGIPKSMEFTSLADLSAKKENLDRLWSGVQQGTIRGSNEILSQLGSAFGIDPNDIIGVDKKDNFVEAYMLDKVEKGQSPNFDELNRYLSMLGFEQLAPDEVEQKTGDISRTVEVIDNGQFSHRQMEGILVDGSLKSGNFENYLKSLGFETGRDSFGGTWITASAANKQKFRDLYTSDYAFRQQVNPVVRSYKEGRV